MQLFKAIIRLTTIYNAALNTTRIHTATTRLRILRSGNPIQTQSCLNALEAGDCIVVGLQSIGESATEKHNVDAAKNHYDKS